MRDEGVDQRRNGLSNSLRLELSGAECRERAGPVESLTTSPAGIKYSFPCGLAEQESS